MVATRQHPATPHKQHWKHKVTQLRGGLREAPSTVPGASEMPSEYEPVLVMPESVRKLYIWWLEQHRQNKAEHKLANAVADSFWEVIYIQDEYVTNPEQFHGGLLVFADWTIARPVSDKL